MTTLSDKIRCISISLLDTPIRGLENVAHRLGLGGTSDELMAINQRCRAQAGTKRLDGTQLFPVMRCIRSAQMFNASRQNTPICDRGRVLSNNKRPLCLLACLLACSLDNKISNLKVFSMIPSI